MEDRTAYLPLLFDQLWPGVEALDRILSMVQTEPFKHLTVCIQVTDIWIDFYCYIAILEAI